MSKSCPRCSSRTVRHFEPNGTYTLICLSVDCNYTAHHHADGRRVEPTPLNPAEWEGPKTAYSRRKFMRPVEA